LRQLRLPPLLTYLASRLLAAVPVLLGVSFLCYGALALAPGDPVRVLMGQHYNAQIAAQIRSEWGLDQPFVVQYARYAWRTVRGDLGQSYAKRTPVARYLGGKFIATLQLAFSALLIAILGGVGAGIISAAWPRRPVDYAVMLLAVGGISVPVFWLGMMLQLVFAGKLAWLPVSGMSYTGDLHALWQRCDGNYLLYWWQSAGRYFILPSLTLATVPMAVIARLTRSAMLEVMQADYIRTARAKGLGTGRIIFVHALRNAAIPIVTLIGTNFAALLTGAVLTETVFSWPGMGRAMVDAINQYDYPVILGGVILMATTFVSVNPLVDLSYGLLDPRVRHA
jgi:ABC-type dipeptide/oligopeptide/nickel transport system permease component